MSEELRITTDVEGGAVLTVEHLPDGYVRLQIVDDGAGGILRGAIDLSPEECAQMAKALAQ